MYKNLSPPVKALVDQFKDTGNRYAVNDLHSAATGDEGIKKFYKRNTPEELMAASNFLEIWFYKCEDVGSEPSDDEFDIIDFLGGPTGDDWIAFEENINKIEEHLRWFLSQKYFDEQDVPVSELEDEMREDFDLPDSIDFNGLVELVRKKASEGYS